MPRYKNSAYKSLFRRINFFLHLLSCKILRKSKPLFVVLVTNNDCNLDCTYCYGEYGKRTAKNNYSTKKLLEIIDELKLLGCRLLTLHGGEALLRKDIGEILNYCKHQGFYVSLNTNGYLVPQKINELACVDNIIFSLDGSKEGNDRNRGAGCHDRVIKGIESSLAKRIPTVVSATLTAQNEADSEIDYLAKLGKEMGVRIQYSLLYNEEKLVNKPAERVLISSEKIKQAIEKISRLKKAGYPVYYADRVLDEAKRWPLVAGARKTLSKADLESIPEKEKKDLIPCYHGRLKFQIDADGRVVRCWAWDKPDAPNIISMGLKGALKACASDDACQHCSFLANNEHNAMLDLDVRGLAHIAAIQIADSLKMSRGFSFMGKKNLQSKPLKSE